MKPPRLAKALGLAAFALSTLPVQATSVALVAGSGWTEFTVDNQLSASFGTEWIDFADGSPLSFTFTVAPGSTATLTVVDAGFAGDTFGVTDFGRSVGRTSSVAIGTATGTPVFDFDAALGNAAFSRGSFVFGAGQHSVSGQLVQSVLDANGSALDATDGAVRLSVAAAVPEPSNVALLVGGLGAVAFLARRRAAGTR